MKGILIYKLKCSHCQNTSDSQGSPLGAVTLLRENPNVNDGVFCDREECAQAVQDDIARRTANKVKRIKERAVEQAAVKLAEEERVRNLIKDELSKVQP